MVTLTPQLRKFAIKRRASYALSIRDPDIEFRKLIDKPEQAEITMKLEKAGNLILQNMDNILTTTSKNNFFHDSDNDVAGKITQFLKNYENSPNFKCNSSFLS